VVPASAAAVSRHRLALIGAGQLDIRRDSQRYDVRSAGGCTDVMPRFGVVGPQWHREELRTNLWLVQAIVILGALGLFGLTLRLDRAAYQGRFRPPSWVISGTADTARQLLTSIAASVITVVGIVFSITIVTLMLKGPLHQPLAQVLMNQAAMIQLANVESVPDESDRADVDRRCIALRALHERLNE
jgi:uncharacterized membrane protein